MASIKRRTDSGSWLARYRDEAGREYTKTFRRKVDGQRWLDEQTAALVSGQWVDPKAGRITFADYYAAWAPRQVWAPNTVKAMDLAVRAASTSFGDGAPLARLRRSHIEVWVKSMHASGLAAGTIRTRVGNVRAVLRAAVRDRVIPNDPTEGVPLPRTRRADVAMTLPTVEQVGAIMRAAEPQCRGFVALCAFAGLRLGECAAVQVGDVDFLRRRLDVRRQVQRAGAGQIEIRPPKYGSGRVVHLADGLLTILAEHIAEHAPGDDPTRWMFGGIGTRGDQPPHQNTIGHQWRRACKSAGVEGITLHDLRHFFASGLIAAGCDVVTVQRALGHAKATTTLNTYSHLWPTAEDRTRAAADGLVSASLAGNSGVLAAYSPRSITR